MNHNCDAGIWARFCPICRQEEKGRKKPFEEFLKRPSWIERLKRFFS